MRVKSYRVRGYVFWLRWRAEILDNLDRERGYGIGATRQRAIRDAWKNKRGRERLARKYDVQVTAGGS
jgi:hypothetical protein